MKINSTTLDAIRVGFKTSFQGGLGQAASQYPRVATTVPSTTREEKYGWLGKIPNIREWIGDRLVQNLMEHDYSIRNKDYELTIGVDRNDIKDDTLGIYAPLFTEMGMSVAAHPDMLVWALLKAGFATACYDGQYFFDTDHKVLDEAGEPQSVPNTDGGAGEPWFLLCTKRALKPIIYQEREKFEFVSKDDPKDENVWRKKEFEYGVDGRCNVGFGFWQLAWGSKQTLDPTHYEAGRVALTGMKGDHGRPLGNVPDLLVCGPTNEGAARAVVASQLVNGGETNKWAGTAEVLMVPWLA
ncbi:Mu-like prophage major head subunit gpT family protein [Mesorhizobium sp. WSM3626]|uniref:Mu-like prophage major head subunit gpT family protein n=1 Tax=Mesorhizobium sp. WSM3626 TaxID=1040987 RepID=UPI000486B4B1|nr:Mu-like prophage major head subunit gpT family protein [Mesorhizobium sp. WSM3626]